MFLFGRMSIYFSVTMLKQDLCKSARLIGTQVNAALRAKRLKYSLDSKR